MASGRGLCLLLLVGAVILTKTLCQDDPESQSTKEILRILSDRNLYDPALRPSQNGEVTSVKIQMYVQRMTINTKDMMARFDLIFRMRWNDPRLTFNFPGVKRVTIRDRRLLWLPDAYFVSSADVVRRESVQPEDFASVTSNGSVVYSTRLTVEEPCRLKHRSFPHDTQECRISVSSYGYPKDKMDLHLGEDGLEVSEDLDPRPFLLEGFSTSHGVSSAPTGDFPSVEASFRLRRSVWPCLTRLYLPAMPLAAVSWLSLLLPAGDGDRLLLGRLLLVLTSLATLSFLCASPGSGPPPPPGGRGGHLRAVDVFAGASVAVPFAALAHLVVFGFLLQEGRGAAPPKKGDRTEVLEGEPKRRVPATKSGTRSGNKLRISLLKAAQPARYVIIGSYSLFLLIYFLFYCSDDGIREDSE